MKGLILIATLLISTNAVADDLTPRADNREARQSNRIAQGIGSGELTAPETRRLVHQQVDIHRTERRFERDGVVTAGERARLELKQDRASRNIYRQKHDRQNRT